MKVQTTNGNAWRIHVSAGEALSSLNGREAAKIMTVNFLAADWIKL